MAKVLLVEDDELMSRMYMQVFTFEGFDIQLAANGQIGLDMLTDFKPDIMLVDVMMPVMNGTELLAKVKSDPATKDIPVFMLTNLSDPHTAEETIKQGALKYIVKGDHNPMDVAAMVKETLAGAHTTAPANNPTS